MENSKFCQKQSIPEAFATKDVVRIFTESHYANSWYNVPVKKLPCSRMFWPNNVNLFIKPNLNAQRQILTRSISLRLSA